ncbi:MAG: nickel-responsive transcriptional regulator NikR [Synergistaceae bacterium]|jgi:CopG family nickel-responsive transcriptional regulator|nr:nickel-responsive transcriptional regulator NikR [Synergistaceae bacterium]
MVRFSVAVPEDVVREFDAKVPPGQRSAVLRRLMLAYITEERWRKDAADVFGSVTLMYDHNHDSPDVTALQHDFREVIVCSTHVHVDHDTCLECVVLRGPAQAIKSLIDRLSSIKGIKSIATSITSKCS